MLGITKSIECKGGRPAAGFLALLALLAALICLVGCTWQVKPALTARTSLLSEYGSGLDVQVRLENDEGMAASGALVSVQAPGGFTQLLEYNSSECAYQTSMAEPVSGDYSIHVSSRILKEDMDFLIPHQVIATHVSLSSLADAMGSSALSGQALQASKLITIAWNDVAEATMYQVIIYNMAASVFQASTESTQLMIPASTLTGGQSYSVMVRSLYQAGDPLFQTSDYCSASRSDGVNFSFNTIP